MKKILSFVLISSVFAPSINAYAYQGTLVTQTSTWDEFGKGLAMIIFFSLMIAGSYVFALINQMNNVKEQGGAQDYIEKDSFNLSEKSDRFLYSHTTKVRVNEPKRK